MTAPTRRLQGARQALIPMDFATTLIYCDGLLSIAEPLDLEHLWTFLHVIEEEMFKRVFMHASLRNTLIYYLARPPLSRVRISIISRALDSGYMTFEEFFHYWRVKNHNDDTLFFSGLNDILVGYFAGYLMQLSPTIVESVLDDCPNVTTEVLSRCEGWPVFLERAIKENPARWLIYQ